MGPWSTNDDRAHRANSPRHQSRWLLRRRHFGKHHHVSAQSRNRTLTELFAAIRVAEREGVGVDRMVKEMLRLGHRAPEIEQIEGPFVRVSRVGDPVDIAWIE